MNFARLLARSFAIAWVFARLPARYVGWLMRQEDEPSSEARERAVGELFADALETLGATFVKLGQILSTRPDLLPPQVVRALARLVDDVQALPFQVIESVLAREWTAVQRARVVSIESEPLAAASVAQVHAGRLDTGEEVVFKVQRPDARMQIEGDLVLMRLFARAADAIPTIHLLSLPGAIERFGDALAAQLDFERERANNHRFTENFKRVRKLRFPTIIEDLSTGSVLTMVRVIGVKAMRFAEVGGEPRELAERGGRAILKMVFEDAFVHADLHPGNIFLSADGTMTMLDLGLATEIPADMMRPWVDTFSAIASRDGAKAAALFYGHAPSVGTGEYAAYERDVVAYLQMLYGVLLSDVEVSAIVSGMMNILRRHRVQIDPVFTVVNVALLVAEGLGKQLDPEVDLVLLAVPFLLQAQLTAPPGRPMLRQAPPPPS